jgi:hypothetical protein
MRIEIQQTKAGANPTDEETQAIRLRQLSRDVFALPRLTALEEFRT